MTTRPSKPKPYTGYQSFEYLEPGVDYKPFRLAGHCHQGPQFNEVPYVKGVENPAEVFPNVTRWLVGHGYSRTDIAKVLGLNIVRVLKDAWWR